MGGNALKKVNTSRINLKTYNTIKMDLKEKLSNKLNIEFIIDVPNKIDFGDIDVLYLKNNQINIRNLIKEIYNPEEIVINGDICSFSYKIISNEKTTYFQVDLIGSSDLVMSQFYFSYGDIGGIIGRISQYIGLKFGFAGLWVCCNSKTIQNFLKKKENDELKNFLNNDLELILNGQYENIILTTNPIVICEYLNLDWNIWLNGFDSLEKIFEWITKSKYFNQNSFRAMCHEHRKRSYKRPMYIKFLEYIFKNEPKFIIENGNSIKYSNINLQLESIEYFNKSHLLKNMIIKIHKEFERKKKFSGKKLIELGIIDKEITICIKEFKQKIELEYKLEFNIWLDNNDIQTIDNVLYNYVKNIYNKK